MKIHNWPIILLGLMTLGGLGSNHWIDLTGSASSAAPPVAPPQVAGFTFVGEETFLCGGASNTLPVYVHSLTGLEFVLVPGGDFTMGSACSERGRGKDEIRRCSMSVEPFLLCRTECTREAWLKIKTGNFGHALDRDLPVKGVSWEESSNWCRMAGLRLPTEKEWEYACRAGTSSRYCFGDSDDDLPEYAWCQLNSGGTVHPVGRLKANAFGLFDMHGNVWEFCQDVIESGRNGTPRTGRLVRAESDAAESLAESGLYRAKRGGSYMSKKNPYLRSANRSRSIQDCCYDYLGFRPACSL